MSQSLSAVFIPMDQQPVRTDRYAAMSAIFVNCDLVLVEGDSQTTAPKIEVWRASNGTPPMALEDRSILTFVTDDSLTLDIPVLSRRDFSGLAQWILTQGNAIVRQPT